MADNTRMRVNVLGSGRENMNGDQRPSIMVIEKKEYREPRIITNKYVQNEQRGLHMGAFNENLKR